MKPPRWANRPGMPGTHMTGVYAAVHTSVRCVSSVRVPKRIGGPQLPVPALT
jgi:hypothetical protein